MKLSIIIPVYNVENFLVRCLESVTSPVEDDCEVIIIDDGSTDNCPEIIRSFSDDYPEYIISIRQENQGLGGARNTGLKAARGEYIVFLDSDDYLSPGALSEMKAAVSDDPDICIFNLQSVNEKYEIVKKEAGAGKTGVFTLEEYPELLLCLPAAWNKIYRRAFLIKRNFSFPGRVWFEDYRTIPALYPFASKIKAVNMCWYNYLQRSGSITNSRNIERNIEMIDAVEDLTDKFKEFGLFNEYYNQLEYSVLYNLLIAATVRVNRADPSSILQDEFLRYFRNHFPSYKKNPYFKKMPFKYKLLHFLITCRLWNVLHFVMKTNDRRKGNI